MLPLPVSYERNLSTPRELYKPEHVVMDTGIQPTGPMAIFSAVIE